MIRCRMLAYFLCCAGLSGLALLAVGSICLWPRLSPEWLSPELVMRPAEPAAAASDVLNRPGNLLRARALELQRWQAPKPTPANAIRLCQAVQVCEPSGLFCPPPIVDGVDAADCWCDGETTWSARRPIPWQMFAQGEYAGPPRDPHVIEYRLRVDDLIEFIYRLTRNQSSRRYLLQVGDQIQLESLADSELDRLLIIQPDGTITARLLGQVMAARRTVEELQADLEERYRKYYNIPAITVTPTVVNTRLEDLRSAVDRRSGDGGQLVQARVSPDGTVQLTGIGSVFAQGLTLDELKREIDARYADLVDGIEITPILRERAPRFCFVVGEVNQAGRFELTGPTTVMQSIALAGGWSIGANLRQVVVFRRAEDWRLLATKLDLRGALYGHRPSPADEIWLRDADIVVVPKSPILVADEFIELVFRRGLYGVLPFFGSDNGTFVNLSTI